jgi:LPXTG-site transpeptidase (sortase) family protein
LHHPAGMFAHLLLGLGLISMIVVAPRAQAQVDARCFAETGYCITGRARAFWEQNGGLAVFGYPITAQQQESVEGQPRQVQWFERYRLELHPEAPRPYDVQLGRIGADLLAQRGRGWAPPASAAPIAACRFFYETGHNICGDMLAAWRAHGLESDGRRGSSEAESLALFGMPLTDLQPETLEDGATYMVQWFERARFERHTNASSTDQVLFGLLGRFVRPVAGAPPALTLDIPARIAIPDIQIDRPVFSVGQDMQGEPIVPEHDVGWYNMSATPGQAENIVLWGHVLRFFDAPDIPAPFARLKELQVGAQVILYDRGGRAHSYRVARQVWATQDETSFIQPQGHEQLTMVSCIGTQIIVDGTVTDMSHRLITIAIPQL